MNACQLRHGPFAKDVTGMHWPGRDHVVTCGTEDRLQMVRESVDLEWLQAVVQHEETQLTVAAAAARRISKLTKQLKRAALV